MIPRGLKLLISSFGSRNLAKTKYFATVTSIIAILSETLQISRSKVS